MMRFLVHLLGDIHQPLHNVSLVTKDFPKGDMGGNKFEVDTGYRSIKDLHTFWDAGLKKIREINAPLTPKNKKYLNDLADSIMKEFPKKNFKEKLKKTSVKEWSEEASQIA